jgi:hypothetical protein
MSALSVIVRGNTEIADRLVQAGWEANTASYMSALFQLIQEGRLFASIDVDGEPFYKVNFASPSTSRLPEPVGEKALILWLSPEPIDDLYAGEGDEEE